MSGKKCRITVAAKNDSGEKANQDSAYVGNIDDIFFAVVADGVGGLDGGDMASSFITKWAAVWWDDISPEIKEYTLEELQDAMVDFTMTVNSELVAVCRERGIQAGSTLTLMVMGKKKYNIVQVGDSRAYMYDGSWVSQMTKDQTVAEYEKETGNTIDYVSEERKEHTLMQCMGINEEIEPVVYTGSVPENCNILLCSDGLSNTLKEIDIKRELQKNISRQDVLSNLTALARTRGETDNITSILIQKVQRTE